MGADELNFCIRNGNRCGLIANATGKKPIGTFEHNFRVQMWSILKCIDSECKVEYILLQESVKFSAKNCLQQLITGFMRP